MPVSQFKPPPLLRGNGDLEVIGPLDLEFDETDLVGEVVIRFLLVQDVENEQPIMVDGVATWRPEQGGSWQITVPKARMPRTLTAADPLDPKKGICRAIGQAIVIRRAPVDPDDPEFDPDDPDPPVFDSFTWCVKTKIAKEEQLES
jgi:hypothetical protein